MTIFLSAGTALSTWQHPHWAVRAWDFPRTQIACLLTVCGVLYGLFFWQWTLLDGCYALILSVALGWQLYRIFPYTRLAPKRVQTVDVNGDRSHAKITLIASNVQMENQQFSRWLEVIRAANPDVILALEVDAAWAEQLQALRADYPHCVLHPQENYYGLALFSRLPLIDPKVRFLVQDDIPSLHTRIELPDGSPIEFYGVHPRPPEPVRDSGAGPRDAEAVVVAREMAEYNTATIVMGDFNDVAWSFTTGLFMRISGLLDPRIGRGFYNTFHAKLPLLRFPLDHCFHTDHFTLVEIRRLKNVGSDHFPLSITLAYEPAAENEQAELEMNEKHEQYAQEKLDDQA